MSQRPRTAEEALDRIEKIIHDLPERERKRLSFDGVVDDPRAGPDDW